MNLDEEEKSGRDAYWRARESADTEREEPPDVISGGDTEPDPEPDLTTAADFSGDVSPEPESKTADDMMTPTLASRPAPTSPAKPPADDAFKSAITAALSRKYQPPATLSDEAIGRARADREAKVHSNDLSRAISSWLMRKPFEPTPPEDTAGDLMQQRHAGQAAFDKETGRQVSLAGLLAKGVKGEKVPALTPFQLEQIKRNAVLDEQRREKERLDRERHGVERGEDVASRKQAHEDSVRLAETNQDIARAQLGYKQSRDVQEDTKDLAKTVGGDPAHLQGLLDRLDQAAAKEDVPGVGMVERLAPDWAASEEGLQNRNDMREAVRTMLTMKSGKTVTPQEAADYAKIYGIDGSETAFRQGVRRLRADIADTVKAKKAGFTPKAVGTFEGAGGTVTPKQPKPQAPKPPPGLPPDAVHMDGAWFWEENGKMKRRDDG